MRVLVVDDEVRNAELTALELRDAGHEAEFVNGGAAALRRLEAGGFDAVVTDLRMAPPDGLALLAEARERWPQLVVVLMTAYASFDTARKALRARRLRLRGQGRGVPRRAGGASSSARRASGGSPTRTRGWPARWTR